jgi:hypothetical protein
MDKNLSVPRVTFVYRKKQAIPRKNHEPAVVVCVCVCVCVYIYIYKESNRYTALCSPSPCFILWRIYPLSTEDCIYVIFVTHNLKSPYTRHVCTPAIHQILCTCNSAIYLRAKLHTTRPMVVNVAIKSKAKCTFATLLLLYKCDIHGSVHPTQPWQRPVTTCVHKPEAANTV